MNNTAIKMNTDSTPKIYVTILSDYNNGQSIGAWIELIDSETFSHDIAKLMLKSKNPNVISTVCNDCGYVHLSSTDHECFDCDSDNIKHVNTAEEWAFHDWENIPDRYISEYGLDPEFWDYLELINSTHLDQEVIEAGIYLDLPLDEIEESYQGEFNNSTDLAYEYIESTGMLNDVPNSISMYFDYESFGRDLATDYSEYNGHYFSNY